MRTHALKTVRAKLMTLVALSALPPLAALPVLQGLMRDAMVEETNDRVQDAEHAFDLQLGDDLKDLTLAVRMRAADVGTRTAMQAKDLRTLQQAGQLVQRSYPNFDVVYYDQYGHLLTSVGVLSPPQSEQNQPFASARAATSSPPGEFHGLTPTGCEQPDKSRPAIPAWTVAVVVPGGGLVVGCLPLDADLARETSAQLGVSLCLEDADGRTLGAAEVGGLSACGPAGSLAEQATRGSARVQFTPKSLPSVRVGVAMSLAGVHAVLDQHRNHALLVVGLAAVVAMLIGLRMARTMSVAVQRVTQAHRKLQDQHYVKMPALDTGDELEDLATGFNAMVDGLAERDRLRTTLGKYMTEQVVEHLLAGRLKLGGESLHVTVLFTDIRGFTSLSEHMNAHDVVALLNEYFTEMVAIVMQEGGVVDKYIGDAIMAVFGAPVPKPDDAVRAVRAAVRMRAALAQLNERLVERGKPEIHTGIGIHTGEVVAGNIGSDARMEYTVIGDAVNLASRLESATKELHADVVVSGDTLAQLNNRFVTREVREITVKGRQQAVKVHEVLGEA